MNTVVKVSYSVLPFYKCILHLGDHRVRTPSCLERTNFYQRRQHNSVSHHLPFLEKALKAPVEAGRPWRVQTHPVSAEPQDVPQWEGFRPPEQGGQGDKLYLRATNLRVFTRARFSHLIIGPEQGP